MVQYPFTADQKAKYQEILEAVKDPRDATRLHYKWMVLTDLFFLGYETLGLKDAKDRLGRKLVDIAFHRWVCSVLQSAIHEQKDLLLMLPRFHMKTTWLKILIVQLILRDPLVSIGMFSSTEDLMIAELKTIKRFFQTPIIQDLFEQQVPPRGKLDKGWKVSNATHLTLWRPEEGDAIQEDQIEVYGVGAEIEGRHPALAIYDDLITRKDVETGSTNSLEKKRQWYAHQQAVMGPYGQELMVGTPYHYADLYAWVQSEGIYSEIIKRPVIENGQVLYRYFTLERLERMKKRMGMYVFSAQMMLDVMPREDQMFPPPQPTYHELPKGEYTWYIAVDPAATTRTYSDETAITVAAVDQHGHIWVEACLALKQTSEKIAEVLLDLNERYKPKRIGIELGLQEHLLAVIRLVQEHYEVSLGRKINLPIEGIPIKQTDKYKRINYTVGAFVRQGKLSIKETCSELLAQMERINPNYKGKDDMVDSVSLIFPTAQTFPYKQGYNMNLHGIRDWSTWQELFGKKDLGPLEYDRRFIS